TFYPDELASEQFVAVFSGPADLAASLWQAPSVRLPGVEQVATILLAPRGLAVESSDPNAILKSAAIPEWIREVSPGIRRGAGWNVYRCSGNGPVVDRRVSHGDLSEAVFDSTRIDVWLDKSGTVRGWLTLSLAGNVPQLVELDWPQGAVPTG